MSIKVTRDPWYAEVDAFAGGLEPGDFEMAEAAELPDELLAHAEAAEHDPDFQQELDEWFDHLITDDDHTLMLALEQSCHLGVLAPWDMRGVRLATLPRVTLVGLHRLLESFPRHVLVHLAHCVYWLLHSERSQRRGSPE